MAVTTDPRLVDDLVTQRIADQAELAAVAPTQTRVEDVLPTASTLAPEVKPIALADLAPGEAPAGALVNIAPVPKDNYFQGRIVKDGVSRAVAAVERQEVLLDENLTMVKITGPGVTVARPFDDRVSVGKQGRVFFSPFRRRRPGVGALAELDKINVPVGTYLLTFSVGALDQVIEITQPIPFTAAGKQMVLQKAATSSAADGSGKLRLQVRVVQNPVPLILLGVAAVGAVGAWFMSESTDALEQVDRIVVDTTSSLPVLAGFGLLGFLAYKKFAKGGR